MIVPSSIASRAFLQRLHENIALTPKNQGYLKISGQKSHSEKQDTSKTPVQTHDFLRVLFTDAENFRYLRNYGVITIFSCKMEEGEQGRDICRVPSRHLDMRCLNRFSRCACCALGVRALGACRCARSFGGFRQPAEKVSSLAGFGLYYVRTGLTPPSPGTFRASERD